MEKASVSSLKPTVDRPVRKSLVIDEIVAREAKKPVADVDMLLADSPISEEEANALFEAVMADRQIRRRLKHKKIVDR
jgi:hypothetical protein